MYRLDASPRSAASQALDTALRSRGFEVGDFQLEESRAAGLAEYVGASGRMLRVRCRSTGEERYYTTGSGSAWLGAFLMDLAKGCFAGATRVHGSDFVPMSQPVATRPSP